MSYIGSKRSSSLVSATEITLDGAKLKSSGNSITKSDGTTAVLSESGGVVTLNNGTIGSGVTFPSGVVIGVDFYQELSNSGDRTSDYGWGTVRSVTLTSGQKCLIHISGGGFQSRDATTFGYGAIQYDTTTLTTSSQGTFTYGGQAYVDDAVAANNPRILIGSMVTHLYTAASNVTLYFRPAIHSTGVTASWSANSDRPINIAVWKIA